MVKFDVVIFLLQNGIKKGRKNLAIFTINKIKAKVQNST